MLLDEKDSELLKSWVVKKLEDISDADSDVLADYVVALAKTDDPEPAAKTSCIDNLRDFLQDNTETFVDQLFQAISTKSYDPNRPPPKPVAAPAQPTSRSNGEPPRFPNESRKRSYRDWDSTEQANSHTRFPPADFRERPMKQPRRGGRGNDYRERGGRLQHGQAPMPQPPSFPGMPPIDPNNPMATLFAMQQALGGMFPGLQNGGPQAQRCIDYDTKGFCAAGASCPYEHGNDPVVFPGMNQEYDPNNSGLLNVTPSRVGQVNFTPNERGRGGTRGRGRGRGVKNFRGGGQRSDYSQMGPSRDPSNTSIVVESIPDEKCDEQSVRDFFSEFGNIQDLTVEPAKKLAIVKFDSHDCARAAYESPRVVFDNRFVKVFWLKSDNTSQTAPTLSRPANRKTVSHDVEMQDEEEIDPVELAKKQEEAQRKHDEAKKQRDDMEKQKQDLDAKIKANEEEKKKMAALLAQKTGKAPPASDETTNGIGAGETAQTKGLREQLAKLEAEAKSMGINPDDMTNAATSYNSRGRGGFRGRPRGRGYYPGHRGGWAGGRGGAVMRLDNRPKTVAVTFADGSYNTHEEALRQFLLFNSLDSATLMKHPERDDTALVTFNQRYEGENFMAAAKSSDLLHIGKVELGWHKTDEKATTTNGTHDSDMEEAQPATIREPEAFEVAEDENLDHWS